MIISAKNIIKSFQIVGEKKTTVLNGLNLDITEGDFVALMGPSGVGKSTFLYILGTLDRPDSGEINMTYGNIQYDIVNSSESNLSKLRNDLLGFVFQFHQLLPEFTAIENVIMPALIKGDNKKSSIEKAKNLLDRVGMSHRLNNKPSELSGGEQQRIAIARALMNNPKIILADEPTGNLDATNSKAVLELISSIRKEYKLTCLVATHSQEVANYADRICTMGDGVILKDMRKS